MNAPSVLERKGRHWRFSVVGSAHSTWPWRLSERARTDVCDGASDFAAHRIILSITLSTDTRRAFPGKRGKKGPTGGHIARYRGKWARKKRERRVSYRAHSRPTFDKRISPCPIIHKTGWWDEIIQYFFFFTSDLSWLETSFWERPCQLLSTVSASCGHTTLAWHRFFGATCEPYGSANTAYKKK